MLSWTFLAPFCVCPGVKTIHMSQMHNQNICWVYNQKNVTRFSWWIFDNNVTVSFVEFAFINPVLLSFRILSSLWQEPTVGCQWKKDLILCVVCNFLTRTIMQKSLKWTRYTWAHPPQVHINSNDFWETPPGKLGFLGESQSSRTGCTGLSSACW